MENPISTWNDLSTRLTQRGVSLQVSSNFLNNGEQTTAQMATLGQELKKLRSELQEHRVNAVEGNPRAIDTNQEVWQNATWLSNFCRTNGHTQNCCRKNIRDEELRRIEDERTAEKKSPSLRIKTKNEDQAMHQNKGLAVKTSKEEIRTTLMMDLQLIRISLTNRTSHMRTTI